MMYRVDRIQGRTLALAVATAPRPFGPALEPKQLDGVVVAEIWHNDLPVIGEDCCEIRCFDGNGRIVVKGTARGY